MMSRRSLLHSSAGSLLATHSPAHSNEAHAKPDCLNSADANVAWQHENGGFRIEFSAPTAGWLAIGFNGARELRGTRFFMALVSATPPRSEEHVALVPDHREVAAAGLRATRYAAFGEYDDGVSRLRLQLPLTIPDRPDIRLRPGDDTHLMLAWSHEADFQHHSAWRRHFDVTL